jgi:5-methylphenazine-1-carboxylate 1-monooxygenase
MGVWTLSIASVSDRSGRPEGVIDQVEARAPDDFDDLDAVASHAE